MTRRYLEPGTVRVFTCWRCGDVYREEWVRPEPSGYRVSGLTVEGAALPPETVRGCPALRLGIDAAHLFRVETIEPGVAS